MTPTFGQTGQSVRDYQTKLNQQNQGVAGYTPLVVDGIYGKKTQQASTFKVPTVITPMPSNISTNASFTDLTKVTPTLQGDLTTPQTAPVDSSSAKAIAQTAIDARKASTPVQEQNSSMTEYFKTLGLVDQKGTDQATLDQQYGVQQKASAADEIASQILANTNATTADKLSIGQNVGGITSADRAGFESQIERERAIKNLNLSSNLAAAQGKLSLAQSFSKQALDAKYAPLEAKLARIKEFLTLNKDNLDQEGKDQLALANAKIKDMEVKKAKEETIDKMIIETSPNAPANVISVAKAIADKGGSALEVAQALGKYGGDYLGDMLKRTSIKAQEANIRQSDASTRKTNEEINQIKNTIKNTGMQLNFPAVAGTTKDLAQKMLNSASQKSDLAQGEREKLAKMALVVQQLDNLQSSISKSNKTGLFKGRVNNILANLGAEAESGYINAQLTALVPNVARGIYGEVGVLTKDDVELYKKTLPNIKTIAQQNDLVLAMTLKNAVLSYENALKAAVNSNINVSGWTEDYVGLKKQVSDVEDRAGVTKTKVDTFYLANPNLKPMIKELYQAGATDREILQTLDIE